jgi:hypothetical protein
MRSLTGAVTFFAIFKPTTPSDTPVAATPVASAKAAFMGFASLDARSHLRRSCFANLGPSRASGPPPVREAVFILEVSVDGVSWEVLRDGLVDGRSHDFTELAEPRGLRHVRVTGGTPAIGASFSISGLRVFGTGAGEAPAATTASAMRMSDVAARLEWPVSEGATGYNVRYGAAIDKLYSCWQVGAVTALDLRSLNAGVGYWVAVDSFNSAGVTRGTAIYIKD